MKNKVIFLMMVMLPFFVNHSFAQDSAKGTTVAAKTIKLEQTKGEFNIQGLTLSQGTYVFEVANNGVDHEVGFVIAPKSNPDKHIKTAYVQKMIKNGESSTSKEVKLEKGEYIYFCPLNPTPQYTITVK